MACLWCGRTDGRSVYGHVITKFSLMGSLLHFLTHGAPPAHFARENSATMLRVFFVIHFSFSDSGEV